MSARDERVERMDGADRGDLLIALMTSEFAADAGKIRAVIRDAVEGILARHALADDPAQATLARVEALLPLCALLDDDGTGKDCAESGLHHSVRCLLCRLRAALVPGHDHEGGK